MIFFLALKTNWIFNNFNVSLRILSQEKWMFNLQSKRDGEKSYKANSNPRPHWTYEMEAIVASNYPTKAVKCWNYFLSIYNENF
jgi:hypothetical protein